MSKIKNWMMDMQEEADCALRSGARNAGGEIREEREIPRFHKMPGNALFYYINN